MMKRLLVVMLLSVLKIGKYPIRPVLSIILNESLFGLMFFNAVAYVGEVCFLFI